MDLATDTLWWTFGRALGPALLGVLALTPLVVRWAHRRDWLAYPQSDRWHAEPTALMGGIAIVGAATLGFVVSGPPVDLQMVWGAALLLFGVGVVDDRWSVGPATKLTVQVIATGLLLYAGFAFGRSWPLWLSLPLTLLWVVGITNAINLLDNMDGLAAGIAGIAGLVMAAFAGLTGHGGSLAMAGALGGAALGFLAFNFKPARIFMGDCGSLFLGFGIAALALIVQQQTSVGGSVSVALVPLAVLAIPILDTTLVTVVRSWAGRPVSQGGRDHTSHRLVFLGLSETHAVLMLYGLSLLSGGLALALLFVDVTLFYALSGFVGIGLAVVGVHLARANVYRQGGTGGDGAPHATPRPFRVLHALFGRRWKAVFGVLADAVLTGAAFVLAYHLRFEGQLTEAAAAQFMEALPLVVAGQVAVFAMMGMYRGIWRHAGTPELVRTVTATAVAMIPTTSVWVLLHGSASLSVSVLVIDWMVMTLAAIGVRFGFRGLRQYFAAHRSPGRRVLLYGAGDAGVLTLRALRRNPDLSRTPVGFLDDDPLKQNQTVQGLPVVGAGDDLAAACAAHDAEEVIVTTEALPPSRRAAVREACREAGIACTAFDVTFRPMDESETEASSPVSIAV